MTGEMSLYVSRPVSRADTLLLETDLSWLPKRDLLSWFGNYILTTFATLCLLFEDLLEWKLLGLLCMAV